MADFLYKGVVDWFLDQMSLELLSPGDRMPSLRGLAKQLGLSLNTVIHGYELLTEDGWIESRPKSGYFVCHRSDAKPAVLLVGEALRRLDNTGAKAAWSCLAHRGALVDQSDAFLNPPAHNEEVSLPVLGKGHMSVREAVCDHLKDFGIKAHASQLWLGRSPLAMLTQSIQTLTQVGDTVLVLTPCDPRITSTLQSLGRKTLALAFGERGVDLDLVIRCLRDEEVKLLVLPGQFAFPSGQLISNLSLRRWLAIIDELKLPTIEWDMCSHFGHKSGPVMTYKSLDQSDHIVYIGGVESKGADRSASWCLPGRHHTRLEGAFLAADMSLTDDLQGALREVLLPNSKRSLAKRARQIWADSERVKAQLEKHLKDIVSFAPSKGGMGLWMRLETPIDEKDMMSLLGLYRHAVVPGSLMSFEPDANHWLAVNVTLKDIGSFAEKLAEHFLPSSLEEDGDSTLTETTDALGGSGQSPDMESGVSDLESMVLSDEVEETESTALITEEGLETPSESKSENATEKKKRDASTDPLYNPMLDLINHDFG